MKSPTVITGRTVLFAMLGFFAVIFAVNGAFVFFAMDSWPGLSTDRAYEEGRDYNQTLAAAETQSALGWTSEVTLSTADGGYLAQVTLRGVNDVPLKGRTVNVRFSRPVGSDATIEALLNESIDGDYSGRVELPLSGRWQVLVEVGMDDKVHYQMQHEVNAQP